MRITLLQTGKTRDHFIMEGVEEFRKRVVRYAPFVIETVPDLKNSRNMTMKEVQEKEGEHDLEKDQSPVTTWSCWMNGERSFTPLALPNI